MNLTSGNTFAIDGSAYVPRDDNMKILIFMSAASRFTNVQIDFGFIMGALIPMIIAAAAPTNYGLIWRLSLGLGVIPPLSLVYLRFKMKEPEAYSREKFQKTPYWLALKFYGPRLILVCIIWFIYDFLTYPFSIFSSAWLDAIQPQRNLWQSFGWSTLINFFYLPGALVSLILR